MTDANKNVVKLDRVYTNLDYLKITLPSDPDWQLSTYKKLVEKQREMSNQGNMSDGSFSLASSLKVGYLFETAFRKSAQETADEELDRDFASEREKDHAVADEFDRSAELWTNREVVMAARILSAADPKRHSVRFASDNQMRRVYDIIFEVFRYRIIINEILTNIDFQIIYPNYSKTTLLVWLMSYDYYRNKFKPRKLDEKETLNFKTLKLLEIENILKGVKIQLAASFSKFRIKHCALSLSDMLPNHLRDERFKKSSETVICCWINTFLTSTEKVINVLSKAGLTKMKSSEDLIPETFKMDHLLPYFIHIYPKDKSKFLRTTPLFQKYLLILQERRYCLGPAMLDRTMSANKLCGNVAQTHFTIQTAVAYLASLLFKRKQILIVYGAAERKNDYYNYFVNLGVQNCKLLTEDFLSMNSNHQLSLDIVTILATPPNTNTGVTDPVQLVCSKGGDLSLLRAVASLDYTEESSDIPCMSEQRDTLRMAMSKPQVQIVVYETHSRLELENGGMVKAAVAEMNGWAYEKHNVDNYYYLSSVSAEDNKFGTSVETPWRPSVFQPTEIPDKDRFETIMLYPDKAIENMEKNYVTGSIYLASIKRVELMTFDANHLIRMAEQRGLFGKPVKGRKQKISSPIILSLTNSDEPRNTLKFEQMHALTPTYAFVQRCSRVPLQCPRYCKAYNKTSMFIRWWRISTRQIIRALRKPFFVWTKTQMVRLGKRTNRLPLRLKKVTATFKSQKLNGFTHKCPM